MKLLEIYFAETSLSWEVQVLGRSAVLTKLFTGEFIVPVWILDERDSYASVEHSISLN